MAKDIQQLESVQRRAARFVKKDYRYTTSVTGLLDELGWLSLFERRKHSRSTVFHKALGSMKISRRNPCSPFFSVSYSINRHKII